MPGRFEISKSSNLTRPAASVGPDAPGDRQDPQDPRQTAPGVPDPRSPSSTPSNRSSITARPRPAISTARAGSHGDDAGGPLSGSVSIPRSTSPTPRSAARSVSY